MSSFKLKDYPKPWEITLSKVLDFFLVPGKLIWLVYVVMLLFTTPISGKQVVVLTLIGTALHYCQKNNNAIFEAVKDDNDTSGK